MLNNLRVPKLQITAKLTLANGKTASYKIFLTENGPQEGCERPSEMLNGARSFLPAVAADGGIVFLPLRAIIMLSMPAIREFRQIGAPGQVLGADLEMDLTDGAEVYGSIEYTAPDGHTRIQDFLNRPDQFITLRQQDIALFVNKLHVIRIAPKREK